MFLTLSIRNARRLDNGSPLSLMLDRRGAVIGRGSQFDWPLPDPDRFISTRHCEIRYAGDGYELIDFSTNGTFLLGEPFRLESPHRIAHGDVFRIGRYEIAAALEASVVPIQAPQPVRSGSWSAAAHAPAVPRGNSWSGQAPQPVPVSHHPFGPTSYDPHPGPTADSAQAFVAALGIAPDRLSAGEQQTMAKAGGLLRRLVSGLIVLLAARDRTKSQFGVAGTQFRFDGNNPIKFSRSPEEALERLLNPPQSGYTDGETAVDEVLRDLEAHQAASLTAMQAVLHSTLERFSPAAIRARAGGGTTTPAELWATFEREFGGLTPGSDDGFMEAFAAEFRRAYAEASRKP